MAKELPYFKFEPNQWENGNIQILSREDKGLFIDLCAMYWSRLGDVPLKLAINKLCAGNATAFDSLMRENIFILKDDYVCIDFLNEQLSEFDNTSKQNSKNAKDGWEKRRKDKGSSERNATASIPQCENDAIREEKRREEEIKEDNRFDLFWDLYSKKTGREKCEKKFNSFPKKDIEKIFEALPSYIKGTPDLKYRKDPYTWLNGKHWQDEIVVVIPESNKAKQKVQMASPIL